MSKGLNEKNKRQYQYIKINAEERCGKNVAGDETVAAHRINRHHHEGRMHKKSDTGWLIIV